MAETASLSVDEALNKPLEEMMTTKSDSAESSATKPTASSSSVSSSLANGNGGQSETSQEVGEEGGEEEEDGDMGWGAEEGDSKGEPSSKALREELARLKEERDSYESQYRGLLGKLSQMRSTLGDRLRQDAEELDKREQLIDSLQVKMQESQETIETLKGELLTSHGDVERLTQELDSVRTLQAQSSTTTQSERRSGEVKLRDLQEMTERYRIDAESWESSCMEERAYREELALEIRELKKERDEASLREGEERKKAEREAQSAYGLQQVLEEFQANQENEIQRASSEYRQKYEQVVSTLEDLRKRSSRAEEQASEYRQGWEKSQTLEKDNKEKNILIGKLRHEAVILNEHLTEALRRMRANTADSSVDGKLITNLLLQFLNTPRTDSKRFEMLSLIASVLNWTSEDREKAGLQRGTSANGSSGKGASNSKRETHSRSASGKTTDESFSNLFVEFLLSEAEKAKGPSTPSTPGAPLSPAGGGSTAASPPPNASRPSFNLGSLATLNRMTSSSDVRQPSSTVTSPSR